MKRFKFTPYNHNSIETFNGNLCESRVVYYLNHHLDSEESLAVLEYRHERHGDYLHGFLMATGAYHTLWVGDLDGTIAPMDVQPEGWTYPSGDPIEPSWFWQWHPSEYSQSKLLEDARKTNPFEPVGRFKTLTPMKLAEKHGEITRIEAIPIMRLPGIMRQCVWTIEIKEN